jgi:hypothetical protein
MSRKHRNKPFVGFLGKKRTHQSDDAMELLGFPHGVEAVHAMLHPEDAKCIVSEVKVDDLEPLAAKGIAARPGQFMITAHEQVCGCYDSQEQALKAGMEEFGVARWFSAAAPFGSWA